MVGGYFGVGFLKGVRKGKPLTFTFSSPKCHRFPTFSALFLGKCMYSCGVFHEESKT